MDDSLAHWLRLREAADRASRSVTLTRSVVNAVSNRDPLTVLDLATGTGSNLRYLAEWLPSPQRWLLVDRSPDLLALVRSRTEEWAGERDYEVTSSASGFRIRSERLSCLVESRQMDLNALVDPTLFEGRHLVTASALLDLVSEDWLRALAARCAAVGAAALFALTYDGRSSCDPAEPEDDMVRELMNEHQHRDKGLGGPAAGPDAVGAAEQAFADIGYDLQTDASDWVIEPEAREFQRQLIEGWAHAGLEQQPDAAAAIADWRARRLAHVDAGRSRIVVGHHDVAAWPRRA
jgi:SAM-dependent methyltransferase